MLGKTCLKCVKETFRPECRSNSRQRTKAQKPTNKRDVSSNVLALLLAGVPPLDRIREWDSQYLPIVANIL